MGVTRGIVIGGASPTFKYDYVAHVSTRTRPFSSLLFSYVGARGRPGDKAKSYQPFFHAEYHSSVAWPFH